ncbi:putative formate transporter 1 [subsurface metagenome]
MSGSYSPFEIARKMVRIGKTKTDLSVFRMILLGILAGAFIGIGSQLAIVTTLDLPKYLGIGFSRFIFGSVFSVGLILVIIAGGELFTGNSLILISVLERKSKLGKMFENWFWVYFANFLGSLLLVWLLFETGLWKMVNFKVGAETLAIANAKVNLTFGEAFFRGVCCNWLVCLAIWLSIASRDITGKILGIYFPIMTFVVLGFEHSIANMFFIPMGLILKNNVDLVFMAGLTGKLGDLTLKGLFINNLIPVTLGNIIGGSLFVASIYWLIYLRKKERGVK